MRPTGIKVVHFVAPLQYGGIESVLINIIRFSPANVTHLVAVLGEEPGARAKEVEALPNVELVVSNFHPRNRLRLVRFSRRAVWGGDAVITYTFGNHLYTSIGAWAGGCANVYVGIHGDPCRTPALKAKCLILAHAARPFCRGEVAVTNVIADAAIRGLRLPRGRVTVIPNGVDVNVFAAGFQHTGADRGSPHLLMVARMDPAKDHASLLRAFSQLRQDFPEARLTLAGAGPTMQQHQILAEQLGLGGSVDFLGDVAGISELLSKVDVFVLATTTEASSVVLLEAMAAGVPVVASDLPPIREILDDGDAGWLAAPRSPDDLYQALRLCLTAQAERVRRSQVARARVTENYSAPVMAGRYFALLEQREQNARVIH